MALKPQTNPFSQFLRLAFLRSPNYSAGVSGWTINQDGSAEFNNLTIRGTFFGTNFIINNLGAFFYSGIPATGNLIASIAPAAGANDGKGNAFQAGICSYGAAGLIGQLLNANLFFSLSGDNTAAFVSGSGGSLTIDSGKRLAAQTISILQLLSSGSPTGAAQAVLASGGTPTPSTTALLEVQGQIATTGFNKISAGGDLETIFGNVHVIAAGSGLRVAEGSNAKQGTATLAGGTKLVANTSVTANSRIFLTAQDNASTGALRVSARVAGTSFTITSSNAADSGVVAYEIFEP